MSKISKEDPLVRTFIDQLKDHFKDNPDMIYSFIGTSIACSKGLGDYILQNAEINTIPIDTKYLLALAWNSYAAVCCAERKIPNIYDDQFQNYFESGDIDERFAMIVKQLYQICKEKNLL